MDRKCTECENIIPYCHYDNGKKYYLHNRKRCLNCFPFKYRNGTGQQYSHWTEERKERHRAVNSAKVLKRKKQLIELSGGKCTNCGYNKCTKALQFHHLNPETKLFSLDSSTIKSKNWDMVLDEYKKCVLLCSNCHIETHAEKYIDYINVELISKESIKFKNCPKCGSERKWKHNNLCKVCHSESIRTVDRPSLDILMKQINELGYCGTGRLYGVSDNAIRKWIKSIH